MVERRVRVETQVGLHARPAALFVQTAAKAPMEVSVGRPYADPVNAKSILSVLGLDIRHGEEIVITAEGNGADDLLSELEALVVESKSA